MTINSNDRMCKLTCHSFSCSKRNLRIIKKDVNKTFTCAIDNSECLGYMCNYAECRERKLNDHGHCLRPIKKPQQNQQGRQKKSVKYQDDYMTPYDLDDKFRKKLTKKY